jgi:hypothetical protein
VVWLVTFGRIRLNPLTQDDPNTAAVAGLVLLASIGGLCWLL